MSESQRLIAALRAQGYSNRAIARAIGRNDSLVSQIARGKKPGANLEPALRELARTGAVSTPPARRVSRTGEPARVRRSRRAPEPARPPARPAAPAPAALSGTINGAAWELVGWASAGGSGQAGTYRDVRAGDGPPPRAGEFWITVQIEGVGYRQARVFLTEDFDLADAVRQLAARYGKR